jgi:hypothetical protein
MTWIIDSKSNCRLSAKLTAVLAIFAALGLGAFAVPANAQPIPPNAQPYGYDHEYRNTGNGGYYTAPPVVYGSPYGPSYYDSPYYNAPPVVYGPGLVISVPFVNIGIQ